MSGNVTGERQWVPVRALPIELQLEVRGLAGSRPLPGGRDRRLPLALTIATGAACLAFGVAFAGKQPGGPWDSLARSLSIVVGGGLLGGWLGWLLAGVQRPERGPVLIVGDTALVIIGDLAVEVIPAERVSFEGDRLVADRVLDEGPVDAEFAARVAAAIARAQDPARRDADAWRQVATASGSDRAAPLRPVKPVIGAVAGAVLALLLDQALGTTGVGMNPRLWRAVAAEGASVPRVADRLAGDLYGGIDRAAARATSARALLALYPERNAHGAPPHILRAMDERLVSLVTAELAAARELEAVVELIAALARTADAPPAAIEAGRAFCLEHLDELSAIEDLAGFDPAYIHMADGLADEAIRDAVRAAHNRVAAKAARDGSFADVRAMITMMTRDATWLADDRAMAALRRRYAAAAGPHIEALPLREEADNVLAEAAGLGLSAAELASLGKRRLRAAERRILAADSADDLDYALSLWPAADDDALARAVSRAATRRIQALRAGGDADSARLDALEARLQR